MAFTRRALAGFGLSEDQVEKVIALHGTSMSEFIPKSELQEKVDTAVAEAQKNAPPPNITESEEYKNLLNEFNAFKRKTETSGDLKKGGVKDKFIDAVFAMLDSEKPAAEQLSAIREQYEEYFEEGVPSAQAPAKPQFGGDVTGSMPKGDNGGKSLSEIWGYPAAKG